MVEETQTAEQQELPIGVGEKLRAAREAKGLSLELIASETRIAERHIAQIEAGDFGALPGRTYAFGFSRSLAREVGLDPDEIVAEVRAELSMIEPEGGRPARAFEPGDPARVPSSRLAWLSAFAALVLLIGGSVFVWTSFIAPADSLAGRGEEEGQAELRETAATSSVAVAEQAAVPAAGDPVVFTAREDGIWVKFYDKDDRQIMQKQMALGESFTVPDDVDGPQIWTGRPDALTITIGGREVPRLAESEQVMKDIPVTAAALLARGAQPQGTASPTT